jgi:polyphenol oxidase
MTNIVWLNWPAPSGVRACYTLRTGGHSQAPYDGLNMGLHVGDQPMIVNKNRQCLKDLTDNLVNVEAVCWLTQVHSTRVVEASMNALNTKADASYCRKPGPIAAVMTSDCLPVFFCDQRGEQVAVAHAGWRGLLDGILLKTLGYFPVKSLVMAYLGPAISAAAYEVGDDLRMAYISTDKGYVHYFQSIPQSGKWLCDLYGIARYQLNMIGVNDIHGGDRCTFTESADFFSYRRDGITGRMVNMIWKTK